MKTNPNCLRSDCPKEFPEKQNFCNLCGAPLVATASTQTTQQQEDYFKTIVNTDPAEYYPKKTFSGKETHFDPGDILQLPQEPFDPMKTMTAPPQSEQKEEKIFDIPESGELKAPFEKISKPFEPPMPSSPFEIPSQARSEFAEPEATLPKPESTQAKLPESLLSSEQTDIPTVISKDVKLEKPTESNSETPKTIIEPLTESKFTFESPWSSQKFPESTPSQEGVPSKTQAFEPPKPFTSSIKPPKEEHRVFNPQQSWMPPPPPPSPSWQSQPLGSSTPFRPPVSEPSKTLAISSLVLGILGILCCGFFTGIPAIIVGFIAKNKAESQPLLYSGRGMAIAGIVLGSISALYGLIVIVYLLLLTFSR